MPYDEPINLAPPTSSSAGYLRSQLPNLLRLALTVEEFSSAPEILKTKSRASDEEYLSCLRGANENWLARVGDRLQQFLDGKKYTKIQADSAIRLLHDLNSFCEVLPLSYWIDDVTISERKVNEGGEAIIYHGTHHDQPVVIRVIRPPDNQDWESEDGRRVLMSFRREIITHRQLNHPNVIRLIGIAKNTGSNQCPLMMVLPYYPTDVYSYLLQNPSPQVFLNTLGGIIHGTVYLHSRQPPVIHGDLHPGNVLMDASGTPILCDFGLSRWRYETARSLTDTRSSGNFRYLAPELISGIGNPETTEMTDVYALGMLIYRILYHKVPFQGIPQFRVPLAVTRGERPARPDAAFLRSLSWVSTVFESKIWTLLEQMWADEPLRLQLAIVHIEICRLRGVLGSCLEFKMPLHGPRASPSAPARSSPRQVSVVENGVINANSMSEPPASINLIRSRVPQPDDISSISLNLGTLALSEPLSDNETSSDSPINDIDTNRSQLRGPSPSPSELGVASYNHSLPRYPIYALSAQVISSLPSPYSSNPRHRLFPTQDRQVSVAKNEEYSSLDGPRDTQPLWNAPIRTSTDGFIANLTTHRLFSVHSFIEQMQRRNPNPNERVLQLSRRRVLREQAAAHQYIILKVTAPGHPACYMRIEQRPPRNPDSTLPSALVQVLSDLSSLEREKKVTSRESLIDYGAVNGIARCPTLNDVAIILNLIIAESSTYEQEKECAWFFAATIEEVMSRFFDVDSKHSGEIAHPEFGSAIREKVIAEMIERGYRDVRSRITQSVPLGDPSSVSLF